MSPKEWLGDREQALENQYFQRHDRELIERLREQGRRQRDLSGLEDQLDVHDSVLLSHLREAGFNSSNLMLLHLVPLVEVAWSEGEVTLRERELILALAESRGVGPDSAAHNQLTTWLDQHPGQEFFDDAFEAIRKSLVLRDAPNRQQTKDELVAWCTRIAEASGGILRMAPISREERECLNRIAAKLNQEADPRK